MTKERYAQIRPKQDFLYLFFIEQGGSKDVHEKMFPTFFSVWASTQLQIHPAQASKQIKDFFDKKFDYSIAN